MKNIFLKIFNLLTPGEKKKFFLLVLFNTLVCVADIIFLALLVLVIGFYTQYNTQYLSFLPGYLLEKGSLGLMLLFFFFFAVKSVAGLISFHLQFRYVYDVATRMSSNNLTDYLEGDYANYSDTPGAVHVKHINDHTVQFAHYVLFGTYQVITEYVLVSLTIIAILVFNAQIFFILFLLLLPPLALAGYFTRHKLRTARTNVKHTSEQALQHLHEALNAYVEAKVYRKTDFFRSRFIEQQSKLNRYLSDVHISHGLLTRLVEVFAILGLLILVVLNTISGDGSAVEIINIGAFMAVAYKLIPGIVKISNLSTQLKTYEFIIDDMQQTGKTPVYTDNDENVLINKIAFRDVAYRHNADAEPIVLDFEVSKGTIVGISGDSGRGKTTLINLLLGFVQPDSGYVEINGVKADTAQLHTYQNDISYVKQQSYLMRDTILKNITLDNDAIADERLNNILDVTGLNDFVAQSNEGLQRVISDHGKNISGGQRQRIAIARALYKNANVIILDEAFNELDNASENSLLRYFKEQAAGGKIVLLITHNKNSLSFCDRVINLQ